MRSSVLQAGANVNSCSVNGMSVMRGAVERGNLPVVKELLAAGCPPDTRDNEKRTALV